MNLTGIDYLDYTWNPLAMRCTRVSPACDNCWHLRMAARKAGNPKLTDMERKASAGLIPPVLMPDRIGEPLRLKKAKIIGVQFMGDLFHDAVEWNQLFSIFQVMGMAPQHQFLVKTKRSKRMAKELMGYLGLHLQRQDWCHEWPLPNVWLGVTVESQAYEQRVVDLLQAPAAIRFVSVEPGLGMVDLEKACDSLTKLGLRQPYSMADPSGLGNGPSIPRKSLEGLDLVVCGGETGPRARPMHPDIPRKLRDDCVAAGVPFFFKSWGGWIHSSQVMESAVDIDDLPGFGGPQEFFKVGKKLAGRVLDGRTWEQMPEVVG